jgi:diketogulonate reductase-like aldo/keto reductase
MERTMKFTTYNNVDLPNFMYGTAWKQEGTTKLARLAVQSGFRAIDTANQLIHYREDLVGDALLALKEQGIQRNDIFLQTKFTSVNGQDHRTPYDASDEPAKQVQQSFESSLAHLHTDHLDSYVLHGPYTRNGLTADDWQVWRAIEKIYESGKTKIVGVSNFTAEQLQELCEKASIKPMVVQNRCYAVRGWDQDVRKICQSHNIVYQGFSLLTANARVLADPLLKTVASRVSAKVTQVVFSFAMHIGILPLTGTSDETHMLEDLKSVEIELSPEEVSRIETVALY